jgi:hypothetical protein
MDIGYSETELLEVLRRAKAHHKVEDTLVPEEVILVLGYEFGDLSKAIQRARIKPDLKAPYMAEGQLALGDLITQARILCGLLGWSFSNVVDLGEERFLETMQDYVSGLRH